MVCLAKLPSGTEFFLVQTLIEDFQGLGRSDQDSAPAWLFSHNTAKVVNPLLEMGFKSDLPDLRSNFWLLIESDQMFKDAPGEFIQQLSL